MYCSMINICNYKIKVHHDFSFRLDGWICKQIAYIFYITLNSHELEAADDLNASTSLKKLKQSEDLYDVEVDPVFGYSMMNFIVVFSAISNVVVCKVCKSEVKFTESGKRGLGFKIIVSCENCEETEMPNCPFVEKTY